MDYSFKKFIKKYVKVLLLLYITPLIIIVALVIFKDCIQIKGTDWVVFIGALLSYYGTITMSVVAFFQSERANQLSEKVYELGIREYATVFSVESIEKCNLFHCNYCDPDGNEEPTVKRIIFCAVDSTPEECNGFYITVKNYSSCPITDLMVESIYTVGRKRTKEHIAKSESVLIPQNASSEFLLCNSPCFSKDYGDIHFYITCKNLYGNFAQLDLLIKSHDKKNQVIYTCKLIPDIK